MKPSTLAIATTTAGVLVGALIVFGICKLTANTATGPFPTRRAEIKSMTKLDLDDCKAFTTADHPTLMYQIRLPGTTFDPRSMKPLITVMKVTAAPWTDGDPSTETPYAGNWKGSTPFDLDLNLAPAGTSGQASQVLIKYEIDDQNVTFVDDPFTIISTDDNRKMFCKFTGGFVKHSATFGVSYLKPNSSPRTYGSYNVGINLPQTDGSYIIPIYLDPEVENNG